MIDFNKYQNNLLRRGYLKKTVLITLLTLITSITFADSATDKQIKNAYEKIMNVINTENFSYSKQAEVRFSFLLMYWGKNKIALDLFCTKLKNNLIKTGQIKSYSKGDDGSLQIGKERHYVKNDTTIYDKTTGLVWQNNNIKPKEFSWWDATKFCENLSLNNHSDWRLPTIKELSTLMDYGKYRSKNKLTISEIFNNISPECYWSSTSAKFSNTYAWSQYFNFHGKENYNKSKNCLFRCVRNAQ